MIILLIYGIMSIITAILFYVCFWRRENSSISDYYTSICAGMIWPITVFIALKEIIKR